MSELLTTYLQDHHAAAAAGIDLLDRVASGHGDADVRAVVLRMADEARRDQECLERVMASVGASPSTVKDTTTRVGEKIGRAKPNERLTSRSPLSDVDELEGLSLAVAGRRLCCAALGQLDDPRIERDLVDDLAARAEAQARELDDLHRSQLHKLLQS